MTSTRDHEGQPHRWQLVETGYLRTWTVEFDDETRTITAHSDRFSDDGDSAVLACAYCDETRPLDGWDITYS